MGIIEIIIVIAIIRVILKYSHGYSAQGETKPNQPRNTKNTKATGMEQRVRELRQEAVKREKQAEVQRRSKEEQSHLQSKRKKRENEEDGIFERAQNNAKTDATRRQEESDRQEAITRQEEVSGKVLSHAPLFVEPETTRSINKEFMREIEDLMIKGPDITIPNERDFLSEGMDIINRTITGMGEKYATK